jgi:hypothetical protein
VALTPGWIRGVCSSTQSISSRGLDLTMDMMGVPRVSASQLTARDLNFDTLENN